MASTAIEAEFTIVPVVRAMTIAAFPTDALHGLQRAAVAVAAVHVDMRTFQFEIRLSVVIEQPQVPGYRVVAPGTVRPKPVIMWHFGVRVAIAAARFRIDKYPRFMTLVALLVDVFAKQRKARQAVVEERCFGPGCLGMATLADIPLCAIVNLVFKVTGRTSGAGFFLIDGFQMTLFALRLRVLAAQDEPRIDGVIEDGLSPAIICVATSAIASVIALVMVVFEVAADAGHVELVVERIFTVAGRTFGLCVFSE